MPIAPEEREMADKEITSKCMHIDEPDILDAAIAKLPPGLAEKYALVKSAPFCLKLSSLSIKGAAISI